MDFAGTLGLEGQEFVAFVGAGGKKTAMQRLAVEGTDRGRVVGYTTTTAMPPPDDIPLTTSTSDVYPFVPTANDPPVAFARQWISNPERADEKVDGLSPAFVRSVFDSGRFDWVLVKADGARRREFKAPGADEPVVPEAVTHVVPVVSVAAVGQPLDESVVHRPERVAALTDLSIGEGITTGAVGTVLASPDGGLKAVPDSATVTPLVNKADTPADQELAEAVLTAASEQTERVTEGVVTSFEAGVCYSVTDYDDESGR